MQQCNYQHCRWCRSCAPQNVSTSQHATLGTALAEEALSAIDFHPTISASPAIQTPTLPSETCNDYCLGMYQNHSNALPGPAEAE